MSKYKFGRNYCDICGEHIDKSMVYDGVAYATITIHDDITTNEKLYPEMKRLQKRVLLCEICASTLKNDLLNQINKRVKSVDDIRSKNMDSWEFYTDMIFKLFRQYDKLYEKLNRLPKGITQDDLR